MGGAAASTNLLRSSVAPANVSQRSANLHPSGMAPTAGVGVMAAVGNMMANSKHANDSMAHSLDGLPPTAVMQGQAERAYAQQWSFDEQKSLESGLVRWPAERHPPLEQYSRIATLLPRKGIRDVALRIQWMARLAKRKQAQTMGFPDAEEMGRASKRLHSGSIFSAPAMPSDLGMRVPTLMHMGGRGLLPGPLGQMGMGLGQPMNGPSADAALPATSLPPSNPLDDHGSSGVGSIRGPINVLLDQNYTILNQFKANMAVYKVDENTALLVRYRDNILAIIDHMQSMDGVMAEMPHLPVHLNIELAANFLPTSGQAHPTPLGMQVVPSVLSNPMANETQSFVQPAVSDPQLPRNIAGDQLPYDGTPAAALGLDLSGSLPASHPFLTRDLSNDVMLSQQRADSCDVLSVEVPASATQAAVDIKQGLPCSTDDGRGSMSELQHRQQQPQPLLSSRPSGRASSSPAMHQHMQSGGRGSREAALLHLPPASQSHTLAAPITSLREQPQGARSRAAEGAPHALRQGHARVSNASASGLPVAPQSTQLPGPLQAPSPSGTEPDAGGPSSSAGRALPRLARTPASSSLPRRQHVTSSGTVPAGLPPQRYNSQMRPPAGTSARPAGLLATKSALGISAPVMLPHARGRIKTATVEENSAQKDARPAVDQSPICQPDRTQASVSPAETSKKTFSSTPPLTKSLEQPSGPYPS